MRIGDASVSRNHARVEVLGAKVNIIDLGSHNGVLVNGERITDPRPLRSRDVVTLGHVTLMFHAGATAGTAPAEIDSRAKALEAGEVRRLTVGGRTLLIADPVMVGVYALLERLAQSELPVLICGVSGSGKELAATAVHAWSKRQARQLTAINCAAIPANLAESELFGYERGAFSGANVAKIGLLESARGGTVFLDEIGELSAAIQAKLLRVLDTGRATRLGDVREREIDIRIVAATNSDLEADVQAGKFRQDLYFRLSGATIWLPPLRDRSREILLLAQELLDAATSRAGRTPMTLSPGAERVISGHRWPGNVRELRNVMDFLAATVIGEVIEAEPVSARLTRANAPPAAAPGSTSVVGNQPLGDELRDLERERIEGALTACQGNQSRAAEMLGMPRRTLVAKIKLYGLGKKRD